MTALPPLLLRGDCLAELRRIPDASIDSVVTDPPYGLANTDPQHVVEALTKWAQGDRAFIPEGRGFMGKSWDAFVPPPAVWDEALRILKPGGHLLAFAGSRTFDLMTLSIRFAGFDVRDSIAWLYGSGFPKSMDVSKAIDKAAGAEREVTGAGGKSGQKRSSMAGDFSGVWDTTAPATPDAAKWQGWGTALKPAFEPVVVARKPLVGTVAANVLAHSTGALNIDASRIGTEGGTKAKDPVLKDDGSGRRIRWDEGSRGARNAIQPIAAGRWPANVILDESQAAALDEQTGISRSVKGKPRTSKKPGEGYGMTATGAEYDDQGGASRFFYVAKAPKSERPLVDGTAHPTVKPLALMRYLITLVTPPGGTVIDPFAGSGTTLEAAYLDGFDSIGCEMTPDYWPLIEARIERTTR